MTIPDLPTCSVLRCHNVGAAVIQNEIPHHIVEAFVCAEHKAAIDNGSAWDWEDGRVLMGNDLPALTTYIVRDSEGTAGVTLTLENTQSDKPFSMFLTPEAVDRFLGILRTRGTEDAG